MEKHGGMSVALAASRKSAASGGVATHGLAANHGLAAHVAHLNLPGGATDGDNADKSDVRNLVGKGFCHLFGRPGDKEVFRYDENLIKHTPEVQGPLRTALMKLAYALESDNAKTGVTSYDDPAEAKNDENQCIPSGYTYLLQLVAHDLVQSVSPLGVTDDGRIALNNNRAAPLRLDSIYNGGPQNSPLLYEPDPTDRMAPGPSLRLGPLDTKKAFVCPFRDLARVDLTTAIEDVNRQVANPAAPPRTPRLRDVLIGDARNDDHALLSQLTVVFHLLHNGLVKWTEENLTDEVHADNGQEKVIDRYYFARMAATLIFRNILRFDLMPRLLHPAIYNLYEGATRPKVFTFEGWMPLELTHGALRVCHAMLRQKYQFNKGNSFDLAAVLDENSANRVSMPLPEFWAVAWSYFFDINDSAKDGLLNLSLRLRPRYQNQTQVESIFAKFDETTKPGLAYRDMLSAALAGLWSASAMMDKLAKSPDPALAEVFRKATLADEPYRTKVIRTWLEKTSAGVHAFDAAELDALAKDPPLPFFLMFEAMKDKGSSGMHLGPLGSLIVAAVIYGILDADPLAPRDKNSLAEQLDDLHDNVLGGAVKKLDFPELKSMASLIHFVAERNGLTNATPPFI